MQREVLNSDLFEFYKMKKKEHRGDIFEFANEIM